MNSEDLKQPNDAMAGATEAPNGGMPRRGNGVLVTAVSAAAVGLALPLIRVGTAKAEDSCDSSGSLQQISDLGDCADCTNLMSPADCSPTDAPPGAFDGPGNAPGGDVPIVTDSGSTGTTGSTGDSGGGGGGGGGGDYGYYGS